MFLLYTHTHTHLNAHTYIMYGAVFALDVVGKIYVNRHSFVSVSVFWLLARRE